MTSNQPSGQSKTRVWKRVLLPVICWLMLVLCLFGYRYHHNMMERTRISFAVALEGNDVSSIADTKLDGQPVKSGQNISLGSHTLTIVHPKAENFTTNFFGWYGGQDFGKINLRRATGLLKVTANPSAQWISIAGPEFSLTMHDVRGTNLTVPADSYEIQAHYPHWSQSQKAIVLDGQTVSCVFSPQLGALHLTCTHNESSYVLESADGQEVHSGALPATVTDLPVGSYQVMASHHSHQEQRKVLVEAAMTNEVPVQFVFGAVHFESVPPGAAVQAADGTNLGETPLDLAEMSPQLAHFNFSLQGYEPVAVVLNIVPNQTTTCRTNLISERFFTSMQTARQSLSAAEYDIARQAIKQALESVPDDAEAQALLKQIDISQHLSIAKAKGKYGDYVSGIKELNMALALAPDNAEAKALLADFKPHEVDQLEYVRQERSKIPDIALAEGLRTHTFGSEGRLFEKHELSLNKPANIVESAIIAAFEKASPAFEVESERSSWTNSFVIGCKQMLPDGMRQCVIGGAQVGDNETHLSFKVLEYQNKSGFSLNGGLSFNNSYVALHPSQVKELTEKMKAQIADGIQIVTQRLHQAGGSDNGH